MSAESCRLGGKFGFLTAAFFGLFIFVFSKAYPEPIGEVFIGGTTWRDAQWGTSNVDDQIIHDPADNAIHIVWTYSPAPPFQERMQSRYNCYRVGYGWSYADTGLNLFPGVTNHSQHSIMLFDTLGSREDIEVCFKTPVICRARAWWEGESLYWAPIDTPRMYDYTMMANSVSGRVHLIGSYYATQNCLYHNSYLREPFSQTGWSLLDTLTQYVYSIACSPVSERTAITYFRQKHFGGQPWEASDQDAYIKITPNGETWVDKTNITNFNYQDVLRPAVQNDIIFDYQNLAHVAFLTIRTVISPDDPDSTVRIDRNMSFIWHWNEGTDSITLAANGWIQNPPHNIDLGPLRYPIDAPQMAINPANGYIYMLYEAYNYDDMSVEMIPNSDLWVTVSTDNGLNWSVPTNITDTQTPNCQCPMCASETEASMNKVVNDTLHIFYILDKAPGMWPQDEGSICAARVIYQKIPADLIPTTPLIPQFSIRFDPHTSENVDETKSLPNISCFENYPNPFNEETIIKLELVTSSWLDLNIYDLTGRKVVNLAKGLHNAGIYFIKWNPGNLSSGVYYAKLTSRHESRSLKMLFLK
ncbi:MAG TPA: hypothetical protein DEO84_04920 [candidate division Zixibacteria bacterium]|nr:hypothetical protein [candidate division Zixibacteria bacterium]HBZ00649.1 hypothetical protein [candidate division Zixibacteria bacterium]